MRTRYHWLSVGCRHGRLGGGADPAGYQPRSRRCHGAAVSYPRRLASDVTVYVWRRKNVAHQGSGPKWIRGEWLKVLELYMTYSWGRPVTAGAIQLQLGPSSYSWGRPVTAGAVQSLHNIFLWLSSKMHSVTEHNRTTEQQNAEQMYP